MGFFVSVFMGNRLQSERSLSNFGWSSFLNAFMVGQVLGVESKG